MESLEIIRLAGVMASAVGLFLLAVAWAARQRRRRVARGRGVDRAGASAGTVADFEPVAHRLELRLATLEQGQAGLAARLDGAGGAEERLQATAGQLLGLVRDKNATLETALAGLDQLRNRMRTLEQIGDAAEARGLFERLGERLAALESAQAAGQAATEAALAVRAGEAGMPQAALVEQLTRLHTQKDAAVDTVLARLAPIEARLGRLEGEAPAEALARLELRLDGLRDAHGATQAALSAMKHEGAGPVAEIAERLSRLHAQKDTVAEQLLARLAVVESEIAARDPGTALAGLTERLEGLRGRVAQLETPGENPYAEIAEQLTALYAQKDAVAETMLARLAPLEARLGEIEAGFAARDPQAALDGLRDAAGSGPGAARGCRGRVARPACGAGDAEGEPLRRDRGAVDGALRPEGRGSRDDAGAAGAAGSAARRDRGGVSRRATRRRRSTACATGWKRPRRCARLPRPGCATGLRCWRRRRRTPTPRSRSS